MRDHRLFGLVVKYIVAISVTPVRFLAVALFASKHVHWDSNPGRSGENQHPNQLDYSGVVKPDFGQ